VEVPWLSVNGVGQRHGLGSDHWAARRGTRPDLGGHTRSFLHHGSFQKPSTGDRPRFAPSGKHNRRSCRILLHRRHARIDRVRIPGFVRDMYDAVHIWVQSKAADATVLGNLSKVVRIGPDGLASIVPRASLAE